MNSCVCGNGVAVRAGQTWSNGQKLLQIEANGSPTSFNVAEFSIPGLEVLNVVSMGFEQLCDRLTSETYGPSDRRIVLL